MLFCRSGLSIMIQEHNARQMSGMVQCFPLIIDRWALQHDSQPASIIPRRQPFRRAHDTRTSMPALREGQKSDKMAGFPAKQKLGEKSPMRLLGREWGRLDDN